jgi:hypothetical protein
MKDDNLKLFIYTVDEYKRFAKQLTKHKMIDSYDEVSYITINTKLMLLRKYGCYKEKIYIGKIIKSMIKKYPKNEKELNDLLTEYNKIEKQQLEYILADGTKLNLYQIIEDVMYGIYLHADEERIKRLTMTEESLRFICVRKYVEELESIVLKLYEILKKYGENMKKNDVERATTIYLGDTSKNKQEINNSPYWTNLYGKDGNIKEIDEIIQKSDIEDLEIINKCSSFIEELKKDNMSISFLDCLIYPTTKKDWGDYSEAKKYYESIKKPGLSLKVRYNDTHTMAYIRIMPQVDDIFLIDTPHIINDVCEISLVKYKDEWKIYSMGSHLDSYIVG